MLAAAMLVSSGNAAAFPFFGKKKKAKTETPETKPAPKKKTTPYDKLMKDVKDSTAGSTFRLYRTAKDKIYLSFPKSLTGRRFLVGGTITESSNPTYINVGYKYVKPDYYQIDLEDSIAVVSIPGANATASDPEMQKALEHSFIPKIARRIAVQAQSRDSSAVIFEITGLINAAAPKGTSFSVTKSTDEKTTWFSDMKVFDDNVSLKVHSNVELSKSFLGMKAKIGTGSIGYTVSFLLLPELQMPARIQDSRIGVFPVGPSEGSTKYDLTSAEDGFRPYMLASRWRLELSDTSAYLAGDTVTVKKPIVWYVDSAFPENWKESIHQGVLAWNKAFESIRLKDVMQVRDFPAAEEDPEFDPDNLKYSCLRYVPDATMNARGPSWVDPVTGEILNASVLVYNDVIRLINNWRFVQTSQVDESVRAVKMPQEIIDESLVYVISHEIGHTLGLMHNMGASSAYPVESLRDAAFTAEYGTTPSIMDYARFNYVAQPGDAGVRLVPPSLGVYDMYAIQWLYTPVVGAKDMWEEYRTAEKIIDEKAGDPLYRYGAQQINTTSGYAAYDPSARTEDLGDDPIKAGDYGISNLKYILPQMNGWIGKDDPDFTHRRQLYSQITAQYNRYVSHVLAQVGGIYLNNVKDGQDIRPYHPVAKDVQKASLKWVIDQLRNSAWLNEPSVVSNFPLAAPESNRICTSVANLLNLVIPRNVTIAAAVSEEDGAYTASDYYSDLYTFLFTGGQLNSETRTLQRAVLNAICKEVKSTLTKSFAEKDNVDGSHWAEEFDDTENWCGWELGEGSKPYQAAINITSIDETDGCMIAFLNKVKTLAGSRRYSGTASDKAHYEYLYAKANAALEK